jgi:hypothetical protein
LIDRDRFYESHLRCPAMYAYSYAGQTEGAHSLVRVRVLHTVLSG